MIRRHPSTECAFVLALLAWMTSGAVFTAEPIVRNVNLRGLQVGGTTTLVVDGEHFGKAPKLLLTFSAKQELKPVPSDKQATFIITLPEDATPGYEHLRVATEDGVSAPVVICLDKLPQLPFVPTLDKLPVSLHGTLGGGQVLETKFQGKGKQRVAIEIDAQRMGSKLRPIMHLAGPDRLQLGWSWGVPAFHGDARLEALLPADGEYTITLHDAEYAVPGAGFFRMRVGEWSSVDQVFPPVVARGKPQTVELLGVGPLQKVDVPATQGEYLPLLWPKGALWCGPRPFVRTGRSVEIIETPLAGKLQDVPAAPVGISGRLTAPFEEDRYRVVVSPGQKLRLEVFAERLGSSLDTALVVRNDKGDPVARAEDSPGTLDPVLEYLVPDKTSTIVVGVVDTLGQGSPRGMYHMKIEPTPPAPGKETFELTTPTASVVLPVQGSSVVPMIATRHGYRGKIDLAASVLPPGVLTENGGIPEGADGTLLVLKRGDPVLAAAIVRWQGRGMGGDAATVLVKDHPLERLQPWLAEEISVASSTSKASDLRLDWSKLPADAALFAGGKLKLPVKVDRADVKSPVKLSLVTSQNVPLLNGKPDATKQIRLVKAVELAAKIADGELEVLVPVDLASTVYDVSVEAELLAADKKTVLASGHAPVRRMLYRSPMEIALNGPPRIDVALEAKKDTSLKVQGKVQRFDYLKGDVVVTAIGLPAGVRVDTATVKTGTNDFTLNLVLPFNLPAGEMKGLKLTASAAADASQPNVRVKSRDVDLTLAVKAPTK